MPRPDVVKAFADLADASDEQLVEGVGRIGCANVRRLLRRLESLTVGSAESLPPIENVARELAERLQLARPMAFLDLETTGAAADRDRIVEIGMVVIRPDGTSQSKRTLVDPGMPIPPAATEVHGISDEDVQGAPSFATLAPQLARFLSGCDLAGFGVARFDVRVLAAEFKRAGVEWDEEAPLVVDAIRIFHDHHPRDLSAAVRTYLGVELEGAHSALADVEASVRVLAAQLDTHGLPESVEELAELGRDPSWLDRDGKIAWVDGAARLTFGKHQGGSLRELAGQRGRSGGRGFLEWMLGQDFGRSTKRIVEAALRGEFPSEPTNTDQEQHTDAA